MWHIRFLLFSIILTLGLTDVVIARAETGVVSLTLAQVVTGDDNRSRVTALVAFTGELIGSPETDRLTRTLINLMGEKAKRDLGFTETVDRSVLEVINLYRKEQPGVPLCIVMIELQQFRVTCVGKRDVLVPLGEPEAVRKVFQYLPRRAATI